MKTSKDPARLLFQGLDPSKVPNQKLWWWNIRPRNTYLSGHDDIAEMFILGIVTGEEIKFVYFGGSEPGTTSIKPFLVFQDGPDGRVWVFGWCPEREANLVFALDLVMAVEGWN
jgi:hypothetical protein